MRLTCLMLPTDLRHSGQRKSCCMSCAWTEFKQPKRKKGGNRTCCKHTLCIGWPHLSKITSCRESNRYSRHTGQLDFIISGKHRWVPRMHAWHVSQCVKSS